MFWLVENKKQFFDLYQSDYKEAYIEVIPYSYEIHPVKTNISLVYLRPLKSKKGYILPISHNETMSLNNDYIVDLIGKYDKLYVWGKKEFLHFYLHKNIDDLSLLSPNYEMEDTKAHNLLNQQNPNNPEINKIIPVVKHYETCEKNYDNLKQYIGKQINTFYNNKMPLVFNAIERNGLQVDPDLFKKYFNQDLGNKVYTQYNYRTTTTRPSNRFGGINFAALNKENGTRKTFISKNDKLVEIDISAYHPTLASSLIHYSFDDRDIHASFAKMYGVDYKKSKELTFKQLYGGVFDQYKHLEFFQKIQSFIDKLWNNFQTKGFIECPISKYKFEKEKLEDMRPQKLFNYLLQNLETATNVIILWDIIKILKNKQTKLVLYTYDAFLLDFDITERDTLEQILDVFKKHKLKTKITHGISYDFQSNS